MTRASLDSALRESAEEVLETMFFAVVLGDAAPDSPAAPGVAARVAFHGDPSGVFTVAACPAAARSLAAAFLALDDSEVTGERARDVVRELANMTCGSVLSRLAPDSPFVLRLAGLEPDSAARGGDAALRARCTLDIGEGTLTLSIEAGI